MLLSCLNAPSFSAVIDFKMPLLPLPGSTGQGTWVGGVLAVWRGRGQIPPEVIAVNKKTEARPALTFSVIASHQENPFWHSCCANLSRLLGTVLAHCSHLEPILVHQGSGGWTGPGRDAGRETSCGRAQIDLSFKFHWYEHVTEEAIMALGKRGLGSSAERGSRGGWTGGNQP